MRVPTLFQYSRGAGRNRKTEQQDWFLRHLRACEQPATVYERGITTLCQGLHVLVSGADTEVEADSIADAVFTPAFGSVIEGIRDLLNGPTGRLDCGLVDSWLCDMAERVSWDLDRSLPKWEVR